MISFKFSPTKTDFTKSFWAFYLKNWRPFAVVLFVALLMVACGSFAITRNDVESGYIAILPIFLSLVLAFYLFFALVVNPLRVANRVEKDERLSSQVEYEVDEERILFRNKFAETKLDWGSFQRVIETKDLFLLIYSVNKNAFQIIPKRAFTSGDDEQAFRNLLQRKLSKTYTHSADLKEKLPCYYWIDRRLELLLTTMWNGGFFRVIYEQPIIPMRLTPRAADAGERAANAYR